MRKNPLEYGIRRYLGTIFGAVLCLILLAVFFRDAGIRSSENEMNQIRHQLRELALVEADYVKFHIERTIRRGEDLAMALASHRELLSPEVRELITELQNESEAADIFLILPDGSLAYAEEEGCKLAREVDFHRVLKEGTLISAVHPAENAGDNHFGIMFPVLREGQALGVLVGLYNASALSQIINITCFEGQGYVHVFQSDGTYVARSAHAGSIIQSDNIFTIQKASFHEGYSFETMRADIRAGRSGFIAYTSTGGADRYGYYMPVGVKDWYVISVTPMEVVEKYADMTDRLNHQLVLKILLAFAVFALSAITDLCRWKNQILEADAQVRVCDQLFKTAVAHLDYRFFEVNFQTGTFRMLDRKGEEGERRSGIEEYKIRVHPEDLPVLKDIKKQLQRDREEASCLFRMKPPEEGEGGSYRWYRLALTGIRDEKGKVIRAVGSLKDVDQEQNETQMLREKAQRDPLTGLLNRAECQRQIDLALKNGEAFAGGMLLILDIDHFKEINDSQGHLCGDKALLKVAEGLKNTFRNTDVVGRLGGDEFLVFAREVFDAGVIGKKLREVSRILRAAEEDQDLYVAVKVSAGIAEAEKGDDFLSLYDKADRALYKAKAAGRDRFAIWGRE